MKNLDIFVSNGFDIMAAICLDFKWLGFRISDPFQDMDNFQTNFFSAISNADLIRFQIPTLSQNKQNELHPSVFCFTSSNKYSQKLIFWSPSLNTCQQYTSGFLGTSAWWGLGLVPQALLGRCTSHLQGKPRSIKLGFFYPNAQLRHWAVTLFNSLLTFIWDNKATHC